jgi:hypothetical protein
MDKATSTHRPEMTLASPEMMESDQNIALRRDIGNNNSVNLIVMKQNKAMNVMARDLKPHKQCNAGIYAPPGCLGSHHSLRQMQGVRSELLKQPCARQFFHQPLACMAKYLNAIKLKF